MFFLKVSWRNLWRNPTRTGINIFSIFLAVSLSLLMRSQQKGSYQHMVEHTIVRFWGHLQIAQADAPFPPGANHTWPYHQELAEEIRKEPLIQTLVPRLMSYLQVKGKKDYAVAWLVGTLPDAERKMTQLPKQLVAGKYLSTNGTNQMLVAEGLAEKLELEVGDSVPVVAQFSWQGPVLQFFFVQGIFRSSRPDLNDFLVYTSLKSAQKLWDKPEQINSLSIEIKEYQTPEQVRDQLTHRFSGKGWKIHTWKESLPEFQQLMYAQEISGQLMIAVLYLLVSFGIFASILMMTKERYQEFALFLALGMRRLDLSMVLWFEISLCGLIGVLLASALMAPVLFYLHTYPIYLQGSVAQAVAEMGLEPMIVYTYAPSLFLQQGIIIFMITATMAIYPISAIYRIQIADSLHA